MSVVAEPMRPFVEGSLGSSCLTIPAASDYGNLQPSVIDLELTTEVELSAVLVGHVPAGHVMREG